MLFGYALRLAKYQGKQSRYQAYQSAYSDCRPPAETIFIFHTVPAFPSLSTPAEIKHCSCNQDSY
jgi:hypothetical protein